jgi:hypothetical protein
MTKAISTVHNLIWSVVIPVGLVLLFCLNFGPINQSFRDLLSMTARIQAFKTTWMEVALKDRDNITVSLSRSHVTYDDPAEQDRVVDAVTRLTGLQVERLFTVDPSQLHCDFTQPNAQMRLYVTLDYELGAMGLVSATPDPEGSAIEAQKTHPDIGAARGCHRLQLTARGYNVKTAMIGIIREGLEGGSLKVVK